MRALRKSAIAGAALAAAFTWTSAASAQISLLEVERRFPECAGMFTQAHIDALARAGQDPKEGFKQWARRRVTMIEEPPPVACQSKIWRYLHGVGLAAERAAAVSAALRDPLSVVFGAATLVGPSNPIEVEAPQNETTLAVNPKSPQLLVGGANTYYYDPAPECQSPAGATYGTQALYGSFNGGTNWIYRCAPWHPAVTGGVPGAQYWFGSDPAMAWDAEGRAYAAYMLISMDAPADPNDTKAGSAIVIARSTNIGSSWEPWSVVANNITDPSKFHDKEMMAIDTSSGGAYSHPGRVYVIWGQNNIERVAWSDDGIEWTPKSFGTVGLYHVAGNIAVGPDGTVYAVWNRVFYSAPGQTPPGDETWFTKSITGGESWSPPVKILKHERGSFDETYLPKAQDDRWVNAFVSIDVNRNPESPYYGRIHLAWADMTPSREGLGPIDVYSIWSKDGGDNWSEPLRVNDDEGETHMFPWLAVDQSDGAVHVAWYDTRNDPLGEETQVYTARSIDGGVSFEDNLNIAGKGDLFANDVTFSNENTGTNPLAAPGQYGDYMGIAAANRQIFALSTDSRSYFPGFTSLRDDAALNMAIYCSAPRWIPGAAPKVPASAIGPIDVFLPQPFSWGINATGGTASILRYSGAGCTGSPDRIEVSSGTLLLVDTPPATGTYSYQIRVRNNCPGTKLTPMTSYTACSDPVSFLLLP